MPEQYITIDHLNTKELTRLFGNLKISQDRSYNDSPCWQWSGSKAGRGYANFTFRGKRTYVHRLIYAWLIEPVPTDWKKMQIDHLCRTIDCWNPAHLELVSARTNTLRSEGNSSHNARKTHCKRGHPFAGENLVINKNGTRTCRACFNAFARTPAQVANRKAWKANNIERVREIGLAAYHRRAEKAKTQMREYYRRKKENKNTPG